MKMKHLIFISVLIFLNATLEITYIENGITENVHFSTPGLTSLLDGFRTISVFDLTPIFGAGNHTCTEEAHREVLNGRSASMFLFFENFYECDDVISVEERFDLLGRIGYGAVAVVENFGLGRETGFVVQLVEDLMEVEKEEWVPMVCVSSVDLEEMQRICGVDEDMVITTVYTGERNPFVEIINHWILYVIQIVFIVTGVGLLIFSARNFIVAYHEKRKNFLIPVIVLITSSLAVISMVIFSLDFYGARFLFSTDVYTILLGVGGPISVISTLGVAVTWNSILTVKLNRDFNSLTETILMTLFFSSIVLCTLMVIALLLYTIIRTIVLYAIMSLIYAVIFVLLSIYYACTLVQIIKFAGAENPVFGMEKWITVFGYLLLVITLFWNFIYYSAVERVLVHAGQVVGVYLVNYSSITFSNGNSSKSNSATSKSKNPKSAK